MFMFKLDKLMKTRRFWLCIIFFPAFVMTVRYPFYVWYQIANDPTWLRTIGGWSGAVLGVIAQPFLGALWPFYSVNSNLELAAIPVGAAVAVCTILYYVSMLILMDWIRNKSFALRFIASILILIFPLAFVTEVMLSRIKS